MGVLAGDATSSATTGNTTNAVTLKLSQLQNLVKRDPAGYLSDYQAQTRRLESELNILQLQPATEPSPRLIELIQFAAAVSSSSYRGAESDRIAALLIRLLLGQHATETDTITTTTTTAAAVDISSMPAAALSLNKQVRKTCVSALILMRNKGVLAPVRLMELFFRIMSVIPDKGLREMLYKHLVNDIRNINKKGKRDDTVNRSVQTFVHRIVAATGAANDDDDEAVVAAKRGTDLVCELYRRRVWTDERAVAIVASAVQSNNTTVATRAMRFFLNIEEKMNLDTKRQQEEEWAGAMEVDYHLYSRKTHSRKRQTARQLKTKKKAQLKKETSDWMDAKPDQDKGVESSKKLYPAIELLRDPQGLAESVFKKLRSGKSIKYEVKLLMVNFCTRLVGNHELVLLPLYPFLQKYMGGHQRDVTGILAYTVQACHTAVPPDEIAGILKTIAHNFITERCSEEQMAVGINAVRAICARVPACLSTEENDTDGASTDMDMEAFTRDLAAFANHRDRSVSVAGKAWTNFVRQVHPALLQGKDRGLKGSALYRSGTKPLRYGETNAAAGVEGADLLLEYEAKKALHRAKSGVGDQASDEEVEQDDDDEVEKSDDEEEEEEQEEDDNYDENDMDDENEEAHCSDAPNLVVVGEQSESNVSGVDQVIPDVSKLSAKERDKLKQDISSTRIFTASDFAKMRKLVEREKRARQDPREAARRKRKLARGEDFEELSDEGSEAEVDSDEEIQISGAMNPTSLMAEAKKKRQSKAEKLKKILAGRTEFEAKSREGGSTNVEKKRKKNFQMSKFSFEARTKSKGKRSLNKKTMSKQTGHEAKKRRRKL
jgi:protein SDA1